MPATIRDIAKHSGVSISTVSRVLNHRLDTSPEARDAVLAAARELNYTVNLHARALTGATSRTIGLIVPDSSTEFGALMMRGIEEAITPRGYSVIVCNTDNKPDLEMHAHRMLLEKRVDGILINSVLNGTAPLRRLASEGVPFVLLNRFIPDFATDYVRIDIQRGAYLVTAHLLQLGHRRILIQTGSPDHSPSHDRVDGYRQALAEYSVPFDPALVLFYHEDRSAGVKVVRQAMEQNRPRPTAIIAFDDVWSLVAYRALSEMGLSVPDDVAVAGHMDLPFAPILIPPLTSVVQRVFESGKLGADILLKKLSWPDDQPWTAQTITLEPHLVARASSGTSTTSAPV